MVLGAGRPRDAVHRPGDGEVGGRAGGEVAAVVVAAVVPVAGCGHERVLVATCAARCSLMRFATAAPPSTPSAPPSVKSFWTSTMKSARIRDSNQRFSCW